MTASLRGRPPGLRGLAALASLWLACGPAGQPAASALPDFELPLLGGGTLRLSELRGKRVLIDFWATWCEPCVFQVPELNALWRERRDAGVAILGIAVDLEGAAVVGPWVAEQRVEYPILLGSESLAFDFGVLGFPALVVVEPDGRVGQIHLGIASREELIAMLR